MLGLYLTVALDVAVGIVLRFSTTSKLWLDEALSVNIAQSPLGDIVERLRHDGAPPLYYFILHGWISLFGTSDRVVRSLSGLFAVATLPVVFAIGRRLWGLRGGALALAVVAVTPYTVYFGTETRMYSLVMLEASIIVWLWIQHWPKKAVFHSVASTAALTLLLYTHYWGLYLVAVLAVLEAWRWFKHHRTSFHYGRIVALVTAGVLWLPWFPIFNEQRLHTGTPWSTPPNLYQFMTWFDIFSVNQSVQHVTPSLHHQVAVTIFVVSLAMGVFAVAMNRAGVLSLNLRVPQDARFLTVLGIGSVALGLEAARVGHATFVPRYAAVATIPLLLLVSRGLLSFRSTFRVALALVIFSGAALWTDKWGRGVQRTQAGPVAMALSDAGASPADLVVVCPDQLGPSLVRYAPPAHYVAYPRFSDPQIVDWYDYKQAFAASTVADSAKRFDEIAGTAKRIFVVWASGYTLKNTCRSLVHAISSARSLREPTTTSQLLVKARIQGFYQSMNLTEISSSAS